MSKDERLEPEPDWGGPRVFMDFSIAGRPIGRVVFELNADQCPKASENFRQLCTGEYRPRGHPIGYKECPMHRIIPGFIVQGGDCVKKDGTGSVSIYGHTFDDEPSAYEISQAGILAMANSGPNTNGCQFFISLNDAEELNDKYVAFGRVIDGMFVIRQIESVPLKPNSESPSMPVTIIECGEL